MGFLPATRLRLPFTILPHMPRLAIILRLYNTTPQRPRSIIPPPPTTAPRLLNAIHYEEGGTLRYNLYGPKLYYTEAPSYFLAPSYCQTKASQYYQCTWISKDLDLEERKRVMKNKWKMRECRMTEPSEVQPVGTWPTVPATVVSVITTVRLDQESNHLVPIEASGREGNERSVKCWLPRLNIRYCSWSLGRTFMISVYICKHTYLYPLDCLPTPQVE